LSVNDPIETYYNERRKTWQLLRGNETFYDEDRYLREWDTEAEALEWAKENFPKTPAKTSLEKLPMFKEK